MSECVSITVTVEPSRFTASGANEESRLAPSSFTVEVDADELLAAVIDRTATPILADHFARIGAPPAAFFYTVSFVGPGGEHSIDMGEVPVLDEGGRLRVLGDVRDGTVVELIAAHAAGLLEADPRHVVVRPDPPMARVGGGGWEVV